VGSGGSVFRRSEITTALGTHAHLLAAVQQFHAGTPRTQRARSLPPPACARPALNCCSDAPGAR
jgi:hypothetical protein